MIALTAISFLIGAICGLRFKVWILVPATLVTLLGSALVGTLLAVGALPTLLAAATTIGSLELGYFGATTIQFLTASPQQQMTAKRTSISRPA